VAQGNEANTHHAVHAPERERGGPRGWCHSPVLTSATIETSGTNPLTGDVDRAEIAETGS